MNELDKKIPLVMTSAMFGPKGAEQLRAGDGWWERRTLGLGWLIYAFARVSEPEIVVEAGAGGSSFCILQALRDNGHGHLHTIDCWPYSGPCTGHGVTQRAFPDGTPFTMEHCWFLDKLEEQKLNDICTLHYARSEEMASLWDTPIEMLVVDSSHLANNTKLEIEGFLPHLVHGGYALFHDPLSCLHDIGSQLEEYVKNHDDFSMMIEPDFLSMAIIQKKFSFDCGPMWLAGRLTESDNSRREQTPFQATHYRALGSVGPWKGKWIPEPNECASSHGKMRRIAKEIIESGEEQTIEFIKKRINEGDKE